MLAEKDFVKVSSDCYQISKSALTAEIFSNPLEDSLFSKAINKTYESLGLLLKSVSAGHRVYQKRGFLDRFLVTESYTFSEFCLEARVTCKAYSSTYYLQVDGSDRIGRVSCKFCIDFKKNGEKVERFKELERSRLLDLNANIQGLLNAQLNLNLHGARVYESGRDSQELLVESKFNARQIGGFGMNHGFKNRILSMNDLGISHSKPDQPLSRSKSNLDCANIVGSPIMRSKSSDIPVDPPASRPYLRSKSTEVMPSEKVVEEIVRSQSSGLPSLPKRIATRKFKIHSSSDGSLTPPLPSRTKEKKPLIPQLVQIDLNTEFRVDPPRSPPRPPSRSTIPTPPPRRSTPPRKSRSRKVLCPGGIARFVPSKTYETPLQTLVYLLLQLGMVLYLSTDLDQVNLLFIFKKLVQ